MSVKTRVFFDTNILIYQFDHSDTVKQRQARDLLGQSILQEQAVISLQVVGEFINVALGKFKTRMSEGELDLVLRDILRPMVGHHPDIDYYERALLLRRSHSLSFYDALIVQAARDLDCSLLYSEDLQHGQTFGTLRVINPFV